MEKTRNALKGRLDLKASQSFKFFDPDSKIYNKQNILKFKASQ